MPAAGAFAIADEKKPRVMTLEFPALPTGSDRAKKLVEHGTFLDPDQCIHLVLTALLDAFLASVLDWLPSSEYTVIYTTTSGISQPKSGTAEPESYEMDTTFGSPVHMELKRDFSSHRRASSNVTLPAGPLFERYQFFSPGKYKARTLIPYSWNTNWETGIFMGLLVAILLFSILYVGISGVSSLQVSYAAFDKEVVGAAQKKGQ